MNSTTDNSHLAVSVSSETTPGPTERTWLVTSHGKSDRGPVRKNNEDVFMVGELVRTLFVRHSNVAQPKTEFGIHRGHVFLLADGVGGNRAGEIASRLSADSIEDFLLNTLRRFTNLAAGEEQVALRDLQSALRLADARLFDEIARHPELSGMATTLTLALVVNGRLLIAHAGDSRCYILSSNSLRQLTQDHTVVAEMAQKGFITQSELGQHPWRHVVTNVLGGKDQGLRVDVHSLELQPGDIILLCSDGLTEMVPDEQIAAILREEAEPEIACERLVAEAIRSGGQDNVTVIVAHIDCDRDG
jgi:PPM family protein phosphatase